MIGSHIKELKPGSGTPKEIGCWEVLSNSITSYVFLGVSLSTVFFEDERSAQIYKGLSAYCRLVFCLRPGRIWPGLPVEFGQRWNWILWPRQALKFSPTLKEAMASGQMKEFHL